MKLFISFVVFFLVIPLPLRANSKADDEKWIPDFQGIKVTKSLEDTESSFLPDVEENKSFCCDRSRKQESAQGISEQESRRIINKIMSLSSNLQTHQPRREGQR